MMFKIMRCGCKTKSLYFLSLSFFFQLLRRRVGCCCLDERLYKNVLLFMLAYKSPLLDMSWGGSHGANSPSTTPPPAPKKVSEESTKIPAAPKSPCRFQQTYMGHLTSLRASWVPTALTRKKARHAVPIASYYKEAILGWRVNFPQQTFKDSKVIVLVAPWPQNRSW